MTSSRVVKLASNENPLGASPLAIEAVRRSLDNLNVYPTGGLELRRVLAEEFEVKVENVIMPAAGWKASWRTSCARSSAMTMK